MSHKEQRIKSSLEKGAPEQQFSSTDQQIKNEETSEQQKAPECEKETNQLEMSMQPTADTTPLTELCKNQPSPEITSKSEIIVEKASSQVPQRMGLKKESSSNRQRQFLISWLNLTYLVQCHEQNLKQMTPQHIFNVIQVDTQSVFTSAVSNNDPPSSHKENSVQESDQILQSEFSGQILDQNLKNKDTAASDMLNVLSQQTSESSLKLSQSEQNRREARNCYQLLMKNLGQFYAELIPYVNQQNYSQQSSYVSQGNKQNKQFEQLLAKNRTTTSMSDSDLFGRVISDSEVQDGFINDKIGSDLSTSVPFGNKERQTKFQSFKPTTGTFGRRNFSEMDHFELKISPNRPLDLERKDFLINYLQPLVRKSSGPLRQAPVYEKYTISDQSSILGNEPAKLDDLSSLNKSIPNNETTFDDQREKSTHFGIPANQQTSSKDCHQLEKKDGRSESEISHFSFQEQLVLITLVIPPNSSTTSQSSFSPFSAEQFSRVPQQFSNATSQPMQGVHSNFMKSQKMYGGEKQARCPFTTCNDLICFDKIEVPSQKQFNLIARHISFHGLQISKSSLQKLEHQTPTKNSVGQKSTSKKQSKKEKIGALQSNEKNSGQKLQNEEGSFFENAEARRHFNFFSCIFCKKEFDERGNLTVHMRTHTGEKPYSCQFCEMTFATIGNKNDHVRRHLNERNYMCDICGKQYFRGYQVTQHRQKEHPEAEPLPEKSRVFNIKNRLKNQAKEEAKDFVGQKRKLQQKSADLLHLNSLQDDVDPLSKMSIAQSFSQQRLCQQTRHNYPKQVRFKEQKNLSKAESSSQCSSNMKYRRGYKLQEKRDGRLSRDTPRKVINATFPGMTPSNTPKDHYQNSSNSIDNNNDASGNCVNDTLQCFEKFNLSHQKQSRSKVRIYNNEISSSQRKTDTRMGEFRGSTETNVNQESLDESIEIQQELGSLEVFSDNEGNCPTMYLSKRNFGEKRPSNQFVYSAYQQDEDHSREIQNCAQNQPNLTYASNLIPQQQSSDSLSSMLDCGEPDQSDQIVAPLEFSQPSYFGGHNSHDQSEVGEINHPHPDPHHSGDQNNLLVQRQSHLEFEDFESDGPPQKEQEQNEKLFPISPTFQKMAAFQEQEYIQHPNMRMVSNYQRKRQNSSTVEVISMEPPFQAAQSLTNRQNPSNLDDSFDFKMKVPRKQSYFDQTNPDSNPNPNLHSSSTGADLPLVPPRIHKMRAGSFNPQTQNIAANSFSGSIPIENGNCPIYGHFVDEFAGVQQPPIATVPLIQQNSWPVNQVVHHSKMPNISLMSQQAVDNQIQRRQKRECGKEVVKYCHQAQNGTNRSTYSPINQRRNRGENVRQASEQESVSQVNRGQYANDFAQSQEARWTAETDEEEKMKCDEVGEVSHFQVSSRDFGTSISSKQRKRSSKGPFDYCKSVQERRF